MAYPERRAIRARIARRDRIAIDRRRAA